MVRSRLFSCCDIILFCCAFLMTFVKADELSSGSKTEDRVEPPDVTNHKNLNLLPQPCGYYEPVSKIVGGDDAGLTEFPWVALLQYKTKSEPMVFSCGGSIINKNYILTAAHCVSNLPDTIELTGIVRVGEHTISNGTDCQVQEDNTTKCNPPVQDLKIEEIIPHPNYGGTKGEYVNDIGLVRISAINLEVENARPVCLPIESARDSHFNTAWVAGWGVEDIKTRVKSNVLQKARIPVFDEGNCAPYSNISMLTLHKAQICADVIDGVDVCKGDSGGSMVVPTVFDEGRVGYVQQGLVSYGYYDCGHHRPAVYTRVVYYMDWILDNITA